MYEREITPMDFRAINRAVSRCAASTSPDAAAMRALRPALWFLWFTGARAEEMRWARWDGYKPATGRLLTFCKRREHSIELGPQAARLLRWLHDRRQPGRLFVFPAPDGRVWSVALFRQHFDQAVALALLPRLSLSAIRLAHAGRA